MTEPVGDAHNIDRTPDGIPEVSPEIVTAFRAEPHDFNELFNRIRNSSPKLAEYIMARAMELGKDDLIAREHAARLALEALSIILSQNEADIFKVWLEDTGVEPEPPLAA